MLVAALRSRDRRAIAFGVAALVAFGVLTVRGLRGPQRVLGWVVTIAAALWFVVSVLTQTVPPPSTAQEVLAVVYAVPGVLQAVVFLAAAVLVAVPLLRPVGAGAGSLWSSAEVR